MDILSLLIFLGEESKSDHGQLELKDLIESVLESVRADNAPVMSQEDHSAAPSSVLHVQELVFNHCQRGVILTGSLSKHNLMVFALAFMKDALDKVNLILTNLQLHIFFQKLDHAL